MSAPPLHIVRRSGFTLIELLAVMLLILTVLGMGVPAMFAAERKSYVNQAMNDLIRVHLGCMKIQRELAARGESLVVQVTILNPTTTPIAEVKLTGASFIYVNDSDRVRFLEKWFQRKETLTSAYPQFAITAEDFVQRIDLANAQTANTWSYEPSTGFIATTSMSVPTDPLAFSFKALQSGATWKVNRSLNLYRLGYSEIP